MKGKRSFSHSVRDAWRGIRCVVREEKNFARQIVIGLILIVVGFVLGFSLLETVIVAFPIAVVLICEMINTAIEDLCDIVQPEFDKRIGKIKDIAAGFTAFSMVAAMLVWVFVFLQHFEILVF